MMGDDTEKGQDKGSKAGQGTSWLDRAERSPYCREALTALDADPLEGGLLGLIKDQCSSMKKGKVLLVSPKVTKNRANGSGTECVPSDPDMVVPARDADKAMEGLIRDVMGGCLPMDGKLVRSDPDRDGVSRWFMVSCLPFDRTEGAPSEMLLLSMDVTELRGELEMAMKDLREKDYTVSNLARELDSVMSRSHLCKELMEMISRLTGSGSFVVETTSMKMIGSTGMGPLLGPVNLGRGDLGSILEFVSEDDRNRVRSFVLGPHPSTRRSERAVSFRSRDGRRMVLTLKTMEQGKDDIRTVALCVVREDRSGSAADADRTQPSNSRTGNERSLFEREHRIVELKSEVNELLMEMGKPLRYVNDRV